MFNTKNRMSLGVFTPNVRARPQLMHDELRDRSPWLDERETQTHVKEMHAGTHLTAAHAASHALPQISRIQRVAIIPGWAT